MDQSPSWSAGQGLAAPAMLLRDVEEPTRFVSFGPWEDIQMVWRWRGLTGFQERVASLTEVLVSFEPRTLELVARPSPTRALEALLMTVIPALVLGRQDRIEESWTMDASVGDSIVVQSERLLSRVGRASSRRFWPTIRRAFVSSGTTSTRASSLPAAGVARIERSKKKRLKA